MIQKEIEFVLMTATILQRKLSEMPEKSRRELLGTPCIYCKVLSTQKQLQLSSRHEKRTFYSFGILFLTNCCYCSYALTLFLFFIFIFFILFFTLVLIERCHRASYRILHLVNLHICIYIVDRIVNRTIFCSKVKGTISFNKRTFNAESSDVICLCKYIRNFSFLSKIQ